MWCCFYLFDCYRLDVHVANSQGLIERGVIRYLYIIIDFSEAMQAKDLKVSKHKHQNRKKRKRTVGDEENTVRWSRAITLSKMML
jgi:hypothetical protein